MSAGATIRLELVKTRGRITVSLVVMDMGGDYIVMASGGKTHTGALAIASSGIPLCQYELPGHREGELASRMATAFSAALGNTTTVCAGIHYADISREEIDAVLELCADLTRSAINHLQYGKREC